MSRSAKTVAWIAWCVAWAVVWFALGFSTLGLTWTLTVLSLGAACLPVRAVASAMPRVQVPRPAALRGRPAKVETLQS
jgi:hypothetical protein